MKHLIILGFIFAIIGCSRDNFDNPTLQDLQGKWIEVKSKTDTLSFSVLNGKNIVMLNRDKEIINGELIPKRGTGPYEYKLKEGNISLNWMLSSNSAFNDFRLTFKGNKLIIGNFYDSTLDNSLTFEKIH